MQVINGDGDVCYVCDVGNVVYAEVYDDNLYYIMQDGCLHVLNLDTGEKKRIDGVKTSVFTIRNDIVYYEYENHSIYTYSLKTGETKELFVGRYCFYFCVTDDCLFVSDYKRDNCVTVIDLDGNIIKETDIKTISFCVQDKIVYYMPLFNENGEISVDEYANSLKQIKQAEI